MVCRSSCARLNIGVIFINSARQSVSCTPSTFHIARADNSCVCEDICIDFYDISYTQSTFCSSGAVVVVVGGGATAIIVVVIECPYHYY